MIGFFVMLLATGVSLLGILAALVVATVVMFIGGLFALTIRTSAVAAAGPLRWYGLYGRLNHQNCPLISVITAFVTKVLRFVTYLQLFQRHCLERNRIYLSNLSLWLPLKDSSRLYPTYSRTKKERASWEAQFLYGIRELTDLTPALTALQHLMRTLRIMAIFLPHLPRTLMARWQSANSSLLASEQLFAIGDAALGMGE